MRVHENYSKIEILRLQSPMQTKVTALIVDRKLSLEIVVKDDTKDNPAETIGLTTCSISEATFGLMFLYLRPCGCNRNCIAAANFEIVSYYVITTSLFQSQIFCIVLMVQITCAHTVWNPRFQCLVSSRGFDGENFYSLSVNPSGEQILYKIYFACQAMQDLWDLKCTI